jgi:abortive infection bacteriophage resistance protein
MQDYSAFCGLIFNLFSFEDVNKFYQNFVLKMHNMMIKKWVLCNKLAKQWAHYIKAITPLKYQLIPRSA